MSANLQKEAKWETSFPGFLYRQLFVHAPPSHLAALSSSTSTTSTANLTGQTAIVTGSNTGLGLESARQLLALGLSHLIIAVRSVPKGEVAAETLRKEQQQQQHSNNNTTTTTTAAAAAKIEVWHLDMESYESITEFVKRAETELDRLDIALLNAGLTPEKLSYCEGTKHETTLQVNTISTALLGILLLPLLSGGGGRTSLPKSTTTTTTTTTLSTSTKSPTTTTKPPPGRLTIVASDVQYMVKWPTPPPTTSLLSFRDTDPATTTTTTLSPSQKFDGFQVYAYTKYLITAFTARLATDHVDPSKVIINITNPGLTKGTEFFRNMPWIVKKLMGVVARGPVAAASIYLDAAVVRGVESHGSFVSDWAIKPFAELMYTPTGEKIADSLYKEIMEELKPFGVEEIIASMK